MSFNRIHVPLTVAVQDELQARIDDGTFDEEWILSGLTVKRANNPVDKLKESNQLTIVVYPGQRLIEEDYRGSRQRVYRTVIAVMEKIDLAGDTAAELARQDDLIGLGEAIEQHFEELILRFDGLAAGWLEGETGGAGLLPFVPNFLTEWNQFVTIVALHYAVVF